MSSNSRSKYTLPVIECITYPFLFSPHPQRAPCFAHEMALVIEKTVKDSLWTTKAYKSMCRAINSIRKSSKTVQLIAGKQEKQGRVSLMSPSNTRWGANIQVKSFVLVLVPIIISLYRQSSGTSTSQRSSAWRATRRGLKCQPRRKSRSYATSSRYFCHWSKSLRRSRARRT
jgi:hypothetical protein